jgi:hypothetical protein
MEEKNTEKQEEQQNYEGTVEQTESGAEKKPGTKEEPKRSGEPEKQEKTAEPEQPLLDEPIQVKDYIYLNILTLEGKAWAYMDLIAHPETQKHVKDLNQAKLAIDTIDTLFKIVQEYLTHEQKKDLQTRLTNLRLNFVKK